MPSTGCCYVYISGKEIITILCPVDEICQQIPREICPSERWFLQSKDTIVSNYTHSKLLDYTKPGCSYIKDIYSILFSIKMICDCIFVI